MDIKMELAAIQEIGEVTTELETPQINEHQHVKSGTHGSNRRSDVWKFMTREPNTRQVSCKLCGLLLTASSRSGTSNLRNHLISRHSDLYKPKSKPYRGRPKHGLNDSYGTNGGEQGGHEDGFNGEELTEIQGNEAAEFGNEPGKRGSAHGAAPARKKSKKSKSYSCSAIGSPSNASGDKFFMGETTLFKKRKPTANFETRAPSVLTNKIFRMLVEDLLPVSIVEGAGFRALLDDVQRGCPIPTKAVLEDLLSNRVNEGREKLGARFAVDDQKIGLTCDLWTDFNHRNYITLTANLITKDWKYESWIIGTIEIGGNTTDEDVSHKMRTLCLECNISLGAVVGVVYGTECGYPLSDITERLRVLKAICAFMSWECRPCTGELLGISVQNALSVPPVSSLIIAAERLISHLIVHKETLDALCASVQQQKQAPMFVLCDASSRWEMIFTMIGQLAEMQEPISQVLEDKEQNLTEQQWKLLHEMVQALQCVKAAIAVMGDARNKSLSCWLPVIQGVMQNIDAHCSADELSEDGQIFLNTLKTELQARCELNEILPSSLMMQASAVDPRFHHLRFLSDEDRIPVIEELKQHLADLPKESEKTTVESQEDSAFFALLGEDEFNKKQIKPEDEIDLFRLERPVSRETDPLNWWQLNESRFPGLAKLAKGILCVPAAATPLCLPDEVKTAMENRKRLESVKNVDAQLFLHKNIMLFM